MTERPSRESVLMATAFEWAKRSTCTRAHVGALISREGRILTTGYNGAPAGMPHCRHQGALNPVLGALTTGCQIAVHAEANVVAFAARFGLATDGTELFTTCSPCLNCANLVINAGIVSVYYAVPYRDMSGVDLLKAAGINVTFFNDVHP